MRLRSKLILFLALTTILPLAAYGVFATWSGMKGSREGVTAGTRAAASEVAKRVGAFVRGRVDVVRAIGASVSPGNGLDDAESVHVLTRALLDDPTLRYLIEYDAKDHRIRSTLLPRKGVSDLVQRAARRALATGKAQTTPVVVGDNVLPVMAIAVPIHKLGRTVGALSAEVDTLELWSMVHDLRLGRTGYTYLIDRRGHLFAHGIAKELVYAIQQKPYPVPSIVTSLKASGPATSATYFRRDGLEVVGAAAPVPGTRWVAVVETPADEAFAHARRLGIVLIILLLVSLGVVGTTAYLGAQSVSRPVEEMATAARHIGEGDFGARVGTDRHDELGDLARGFNHMAEDLGELTEEMKRTERLVFFGHIASGLAHDLKRPFQHLITQVRTALDLPDSEKARTNLERTLDREQAYIDRLFADLSDFANPGEPERAVVDLRRLVERTRDALAPAASDVGVHLSFDVDGDGDPTIAADGIALERMIRNLVENALDVLRGRGGEVQLHLFLGPHDVSLEVVDDGPGIPPELLPDLFDAFRTTKGSGKGLGLGLAVVRRICQEHGGSITAQNLAEGGASFRIRLPRVAAGRESERTVDPAA